MKTNKNPQPTKPQTNQQQQKALLQFPISMIKITGQGAIKYLYEKFIAIINPASISPVSIFDCNHSKLRIPQLSSQNSAGFWNTFYIIILINQLNLWPQRSQNIQRYGIILLTG